jgi:diadenosine tetraphosphate (Ap4A) HIT family hydrolase
VSGDPARTAIHERVEQAQRGDNPAAVCRLPSGWVVLGDDQTLRGYCLLLSDPVALDLNALDDSGRAQFLTDMARIGDAVKDVTGAALVNYMILGNQDRALHAHVHPRFADEPDDKRTKPPFIYAMTGALPVPFDAARDRALIEAIADRLASSSKETLR